MQNRLLVGLALVLALVLSACGNQAVKPKTGQPGVVAMAVGPTGIINPWQSGNAQFECNALSATTGVQYDGGWKFDPPTSQTATVDAFGNTITIVVSNGKTFDWSSNFGIGAVIVKAGTGANYWAYNPQATGDTGLYAFDSKDISHITFCWQYQLTVSKTANTSYKRSWNWTIDKESPTSTLTLTGGQTHTVNYTVKVDASSTDSDFKVTGTITIENNTPITFLITSVADQMSGDINADVECSPSFPTNVAPGDSVTCSYEAELPNKDTRTNTATISYTKLLSSLVRTATATAPVVFGAPSQEVDECITVDDDKKGALGTVCANQLPKTFSYSLNVGPYTCSGSDRSEFFTNTATFQTNDTGTTGSDRVTVTVLVKACNVGCTLTQGYWKTHSDRGPAPYDDAWKVLGSEEDTLFFNSNRTWYAVFWTPPAGNAFYNLAHQYMAAKLNRLNGAASTLAVDAAITASETLFNSLAADSTALSATQRKTALALAATLDQYNKGQIGPGHCSE